ncbi:hypothetical protein AXI70_gp03 [Cronobacter phage Dev-CD-23823]|uniref:Uncharacterized protein n=1 Tax=Cronobacter phage Dev-CD-23823 TaxID=1712539 RepID=A0A0K8IWJ4_9CAUD|nr:hypothetical protein AXI70_gp03 [Cronobacter phage Dev-CD-23823]CUH74578.1 hypothetical protein [Cronobacter phage Dev-CD-23823]
MPIVHKAVRRIRAVYVAPVMGLYHVGWGHHKLKPTGAHRVVEKVWEVSGDCVKLTLEMYGEDGDKYRITPYIIGKDVRSIDIEPHNMITIEVTNL